MTGSVKRLLTLAVENKVYSQESPVAVPEPGGNCDVGRCEGEMRSEGDGRDVTRGTEKHWRCQDFY